MSNDKQFYQGTPLLAMMPKHFALCALLFALCFLLVFVTSCASVKSQGESSESFYNQNYGQVTIFLNGPDRSTLDISFDISAVSIMAEGGIYREVMSTPMTINSLNVMGRQILLAERSLPEGKYEKIKFTVKQASIRRKDRIASLALPPEGIEIPINVMINRNQNTSLFLHWNADESIVNGYQFNPSITVKVRRPELSALLIYVTNEDSNNVSVINRQLDEVVSTVMVGKRPRGIAVNLRKEHLRVYVANSSSNSITVIDPTTNKVENEIPIRYGREPEGIAVASISPEKEFIFVTNYGSNTVSVVDGLTYQEMEKIDVGNGPIAVAVDPPVETLIESRSLTPQNINILRSYREKFINAYVANKNSKEVTVIRMDILRNRVEEVFNVTVEWNPTALSVDYPRGKLYVANYGYDNLSVIDIVEIVKGNRTGAVSAISNIGTSSVGVTADPSLDRIYLLKELPGELMIIRPLIEEGLQRISMTPVMGTVPVGSSPRSLILDPEDRKIYIVNRGSNNVSVIDKTTRREEKVIPVGRRPYGIAMFPE